MLLLVLNTVLLAGAIPAEEVSTTTTTYDLEVPGAEPIRIVEGEPLWRAKFEHRSLRIDKNAQPEDEALDRFLMNLRNNKYKISQQEMENVELITKPEEEQDHEGKSWDMMQYQKHKHPYDDRKGWVTMEPVPWSISKISKWQNKQRPQKPAPSWDLPSYGEEIPKPWQQKPDLLYNMDRPDAQPLYAKPSAIYGQKVQVDYNTRHKHDKNCNDYPGNSEIITDGLAPDFPQPYEANRRRGTDMNIHPENHPFSGEGDWVLLSTTRGYKYPQPRQRSLQIDPAAIGAHRSVRLTVLPPLKGSKVNMTTSHGGLLQVESTFQTVEQAKNQYFKKQKQKLKKNKLVQARKPARQMLQPTTITTTRRNTSPDSSTVLAAVGAGMIPATMAMLVPMAMGGRRKRGVGGTRPIRVTLPHNLL